MKGHRIGFKRVWPVWAAAVFAAGVPLFGAFSSPLEAAESAALPLEISIPEYRGVQLQTVSVSMAAVIGGKPAERSFSFLLSSTGSTRRKLTARLAAPLPAGISMTAEAVFPQGGRSTGPQVLGNAEVDLLTGIQGVFGACGRGTLKMQGSNILAPGTGRTVLVLAVREM